MESSPRFVFYRVLMKNEAKPARKEAKMAKLGNALMSQHNSLLSRHKLKVANRKMSQQKCVVVIILEQTN